MKKKQKKKNKKNTDAKEDKKKDKKKDEKPENEDESSTTTEPKKDSEEEDKEKEKSVTSEAATTESSEETKPLKSEPEAAESTEATDEPVKSTESTDNTIAEPEKSKSAEESILKEEPKASSKSEPEYESTKKPESSATPSKPTSTSTSSPELEEKLKALELKLLEANLKISDLQSDVDTYKLLADSKPEPKTDSQLSSNTKQSSSGSPSTASSSSNDHELKTQIESLKVENAYLNDKVYSLESRVANMIAMNKKKSLDFPNRDGTTGAGGSSDIDSEIASLNSPIIDAVDGMPRAGGVGGNTTAGQNHPRLASFADMDLYGDINKIKDINKDMQRWSNWKVDIRNWRGLGVGPIFEA